ncbi:MAG TPA: response regulator [Ramlibacter sp.]|uniref:hybrid sensor histidine kinase/response regulator n=1 Tax=Ramlibacter sp. TaxID=1917967 RepID=UPI002B77273F|nr:response regulator [Ramlibacter sp.]HVZ46058.1 response regulator [Ramlibacter sp.]
MKLKDLIEALAGEVERAQPQLAASLGELAAREVDDPSFLDAFDRYSGQAQRMGEAAGLAGFPGLQAVCAHVEQNCLLLTVTPPPEREAFVRFLRDWPALIVDHLRNLEDPSTAAGLVDHLRAAPVPMEEEAALKVMHMLGAMPLQVTSVAADDAPRRPLAATPEDVAIELPTDVDAHLLEGFFQEAPEQARELVALARRLASLAVDGADPRDAAEDLVCARRIVHTLKGSGAIIGLRGIASLGHHLEDILEHVERDGAKVDRAVAETLLDAAFCLEQMISHALGADDAPGQAQQVLQAVLDIANRIDRGEAVDALPVREAPMRDTANGADSRAARASSVPQVVPGAAMRVAVQRIDELFRVCGEVSVHSAAMEARLKAAASAAKELMSQNLRLQKRLFELETLVDVRALSTMRARSRRDSDAAFDPLELDQYSELHGTSHALMEEAADARTMAARVEEGIAQLAALQARQQRLARDMQHLVMGTRMSEVGTLESRLQRTVRTSCQATGKEARLVLEGARTLMDGDVLNRLGEPLLHMLRNAVDHGLESPQERIDAGKPRMGTIALSFARQGQQVVLHCRDDGRGLDLPAIRRRAIERGLLDASRHPGDEDIARLVLLPGFSTRDTVSELSGRGVGLDVVREWVGQMNGTVRLFSRPGEGCTIELRFAASLATVQTLIVEAAGQRFGVPSAQVEQAVPRGVGEFAALGGELTYRHGDRVHPALRLVDAVGLPVDTSRSLSECDAVVVRVDDRVYALAVDRLVDARELLVKSPGRYARHVRGVAGLSVLGDGTVAVNLDLQQLLGSRARPAVQGTERSEAPRPAQRELPGVLIVDDALSVRTFLRRVVQDAGYRVEAARDGIEAIDALRSFKPRLVLTDLEMPNMNGVELTSHLRRRDDMKEVPVIMITSRSQDKHRRMAREAGVDEYFTKPCSEGELLRAIRRHVAA